MSDLHYINNLKVGEKVSENSELVLFEGIATTDSLNTYYYRMAMDSLRNMAQDAKDGNGKPVYPNHNVYDLNIGRTMDAYLYNRRVKMQFSILRGLADMGSDDIIKRLENGVTDSLSVGHENARYMCDEDNTEMLFRDAFDFIPRCERGHHPGQVIKKDGKDLTITATAHGARLRELSVVGAGADPDAKMIGKLKQELASDNLNGQGLAFLSEFYNLNYNHFFNQLGYNGYTPKQYSIPTQLTQQPKRSRSHELVDALTEGTGRKGKLHTIAR